MLKKNDLKERGVYQVRGRSMSGAMVYAGQEAFIGIRFKLGSEFLFHEYLAREHDGTDHIGFDTAYPQEFLQDLPEELLPDSHIGHVCSECRQDIVPAGPDENGKHHRQTCPHCGQEVWTNLKHNDALFDFLKALNAANAEEE